MADDGRKRVTLMIPEEWVREAKEVAQREGESQALVLRRWLRAGMYAGSPMFKINTVPLSVEADFPR